MLMTLLLSISGWTQNTQPLNESFEDSNFPPDGWTLAKATSTSSNWSRYTNSSYTNTGSASANLNYNSSNNAYLITPALLPQSTDSLVFYIRRLYNAYTTDAFTVEISTTTPDVASFTTVLHTVDLTSSAITTMTRVAVSLEDYDGQTVYIAFHYNPTGGCNVYIDDVSGVNMIIPACSKPTNLVSTATTTSSITVDWTDEANSNWYVYYKNIENATNTWDSVSASEHPFEITGLDASTSYNVYVKADCGEDGLSNPLEVATFTTACGNITSLPWTTGFENESGSIPNCWDTLNSHNGYPKISSSDAYNSSSKKLEFRSNNNKRVIAIMPAFETSLDQLQLSFYTRREGLSSGTFQIGYITDVTDTNSFVALETITSTGIGDNLYHLYEVPFANIEVEDGVTPRMAFAYTSNTNYYWYLDNVTVGEIPACSRPAQITSTTTTNSATINWTSTGDNFAVLYKETSSTGEYQTSTDFTSTENGYTLTLNNLTPGTNYTYYVSAICNNDSIHSEPKTFKTECVALTTVPQCWDFENYEAETGLPICWSKTLSGASTGAYTSTYYYVNGTRSLYLSGVSNVTFLPAIDENELTLTELQLRFQVRSSSSTYTGNVEVGVMTDVTDVSTFVSVASFPINPTFEEKVAMFSAYEGDGTHIALRLTSNAGYMYAYIDSMCLEAIPECPPVQNIAVTSISSESATITWTGNNDSYLVRYKENGSTQWSEDNVATSGASATITGLSANTLYEVSIAPNCSEITENMYRTSTFTTTCAPVNVPYVVNFEDTILLNCWTIASEGEVYDSYYADPVTYPNIFVSSTYAHNGSNSWTFGGDNSKSMIVAAPKINLDIEQTRLQFYVRKYSASYDLGDITIGLMTNPTDTNTFVALRTISEADITTTYSLQTIDFNQFTDYTGDAYYIAIKYLGTESLYYYCGEYQVDDITIDNIPACTAPTNIVVSNTTSNSVVLSWTSDATNFKVYYKDASADSETEYSSVEATLTDGSYTLENLTPATTYQFYVATICDDNSESNSQVSTFITECEAINIPYSIDFESITSGSRPLCWSFINSVGTYPYVSGNLYRGHASAKGLEFHSNGTYSNPSSAVIAVMPKFTTELNQLSVEFWTRPESNPNNNSYSSGRLEIGYVTDPTDASTFIMVDSVSAFTLTDSAYHRYRVNFDQVDLGEAEAGYIAFRHVTIATNYYWYLDDVTVETIPDCTEPTGLLASNITSSSADLSWNSSETSVILYYKESSATEFDSIENVSLNEGVYTLENLQPTTAYIWKVGILCSSDNTIYYSEPKTFTTPCVAISTLPQTWDFETAGNTGGTTSNPLPACWQRISSSSYYDYPYSYTSTYSTYAYEGSYCLNFSYGSSLGILPAVDTETLPINTLQLSLYARKGYSNISLQVGVMTDPTDSTTFSAVTTIPLTSTYEFYEIPLTTYDGTGTYIVIKGTNSNAMYVDNVTLDLVPACTRPSDIEITATADQATISWSSTGENFEVYYKESSATDYTLSTSTITAGETDNSWTTTITGLNSSTAYDVYIKAVCDESELSSQEETFRTACTTITDFPYTEDFETLSSNDLGCWTNERISGSNNWIIQTASTGKVAYRSHVTGSTRLVSPIFDMTSLDSPTLSYNYEACSDLNNGGSDSLYVYYRTSSEDEWTLLTSHAPTYDGTFYSIGNPTQSNSIALPNASAIYQITFVAACHGGYGVYLDNVVISNGSTVIDPVEPTVATNVAS
ncbi:MAG: choice-of-anchor J domain-containing protein, partial [Bacteroidota bacterium]|nr:choice-of-anchor J domain-containing protein [Bacteroidota bacterium]